MNDIISDMNRLNLNKSEFTTMLSPIQVYIMNNDEKITGLFMPSFYLRQERCISTMLSDHIDLLSPDMFLQLGSAQNKNKWYKMIKVIGKDEISLEQWLLKKYLIIFNE